MIWFLFLICLALPAYLIRFKIFGIPTTALEILIYLGAAATIVAKLKTKNEKVKTTTKNLKLFLNLKSLKVSNILLPTALLLLAAVISTVISPDKRTSLGILKGWLIDPILLFGLIILNVKKDKDFRKIIYGLVGGGALVALWGIVQALGFSYLLPHQQADPFNSFQSYLATHRAFGPFESPNYLGMYLAPIAALALGYWLNLKVKIQISKPQLKIQNSHILNHKSYFLVFSLCSMLLALFFTKSLGAWLGFGVAVLFLIWLNLPKEKKSAFWAFSVLIAIIGILVILKYKSQRIESSFLARKEVWQVSWHLTKEHPILGIGLGAFPKIYNQIISQILYPPINWLQLHPHNIFLAFWLNLGLLGLISFIWILYIFFKNSLKLLNANRYTLTAGLIAAILAIIAHGLVDTTYWKNDLSALFWIIFGLAFVKQGESNEDRY